jgi:hypothetical protein
MAHHAFFCNRITPSGIVSPIGAKTRYQDAMAQDGYIFIDPHGDTSEHLRNSFTTLSTKRQQDIIFWEPSDIERPFGLNPFTCDPTNKIQMSIRAQGFVSALESLEEFNEVFATATRMKDLLLSVGHAFTAHQGHSLLEAIDFLDPYEAGVQFRSRFYRDLGKYNPSSLKYWQSFDKLPPYERRDRVEATLNKLRRFSSDPIMQGIFGQATNSIDFRQVMDTGKIIILNLSDVGIFNAAFIGAFAVFGIWQAALSRTNIPEAERRTFHLYADEFQDYMTTFFPVMQLQGRKFGLDTVVAHQNRGSLNADLRSSTLSVVNKIVFRTNSDDASTLAPGFKTKGIEERTIERPKRTYVLNVLAHLATHGHSNPAFQEPYRKLRADIDEIFTEHLNIVQDLKPTPQQLNIPDITPATARSFFVEKKAQLEEEINRLLYVCMTGKVDPVNVWAPLPGDPSKDVMYNILLEVYIYGFRVDPLGVLFRKYSLSEMVKAAPEVDPKFIVAVRNEEKRLRQQTAVLGMDLHLDLAPIDGDVLGP